MNPSKFPINWFDFGVVAILVIGILRGRKNGMSGELLPLIQWLAIIFCGALLYKPLGQVVAANTVFGLLFSYVAAYVTIAVATKLLFTALRRLLRGKLVGADTFGGAEYYLGMLSGMVRFACLLVFFLSLLNARLFAAIEVQAMRNSQKEVYGSEFFPTLHTLQEQVFAKSLSGPWIKSNLNLLLVAPTAPEQKSLPRREADFP